ncbi:hypothetical protein ACEQ8H_003831 [Pleosporales sp. CAS-2024a]
MAPTYLDTLAAFTSFLAAYTHTLLYLRAIYPRTAFARSRFHNAPVWQSRHPLVCEWIRDAIAAVREELLVGAVARIAIVIFALPGREASGSAAIMERYLLDVSSFPAVPRNERNMEMEWESSPAAQPAEHADPAVRKRPADPELDAHVDVNLSEQFRAAFIALTTRAGMLAPLAGECSFNISMELKDDADIDPPISHPQPWVPVQPSLQKTGRTATARNAHDEEEREKGRSRQGRDLGGAKVTPIRSVQAGVFRFETWIEEAKAKFERGTDSSETSFGSSIG